MFNRRKKSRQFVGLGLDEVLARCRQKREKLDRIRGDTFRGVSVVVRRELNLAKPVNLIAGLLILALGFSIGYWSKDQDSPQITTESYGQRGYLDQLFTNESGETMLITPGEMEESEPDAMPVAEPEPAANDSIALSSDSRVQPSSSDTLLREVRDLLERVKRGE